jgi:hypothetical protein
MTRTAACLLLAATACAGQHAARNPPSDAAVMKDFAERVRDYLVLHRKLEAQLPALGAEASPEEIDRHQRALGDLLRAARPDARPGEIFTPEVQRWLARAFERVFTGTSGKNLLGTIMDENPGVPQLVVNERYPDTVPLSTMPPEVLALLPELEEDMEYRFVGRRLVLFDAHGHIIVDFTDELLPR